MPKESMLKAETEQLASMAPPQQIAAAREILMSVSLERYNDPQLRFTEKHPTVVELFGPEVLAPAFGITSHDPHYEALIATGIHLVAIFLPQGAVEITTAGIVDKFAQIANLRAAAGITSGVYGIPFSLASADFRYSSTMAELKKLLTTSKALHRQHFPSFPSHDYLAVDSAFTNSFIGRRAFSLYRLVIGMHYDAVSDAWLAAKRGVADLVALKVLDADLPINYYRSR